MAKKELRVLKNIAKKLLEYYNQVFSLIKIVDQEESKKFLLQISKFRQLSLSLIETMKKIEENPSIMNSKDKQQSQWSKEIKNNLTAQSDKCLHHERDINSYFRDFYEKHLKDILE